MKTYVTFGQEHAHRANGNTFDKDSIAVIEAKNAEEGRNLAFELFGFKFGTSYPEESWKEAEMMSFFPRGYLKAN